ncbi:type II secretion system F family protein [Candidatus Gracilibacteria bacterium]|nr:type II secretion system F family protein [Candidatus Gracilibacteria bacterium]
MADFLIIDDNQKGTDTTTSKKQGSIIDKINTFFLSLQKIKVKEKAVFYRLLSTMTNSGMGVMKSVAVLEAQEKNKTFKATLQAIGAELSNGKNLSDCLEMFPANFEDAEVGMVRAGEKTGKLNESLRDLADQVEKIDSISGKLKSAMMYPAFIMLVVMGVVFILMTMVVPKLLEIFGDPSELPDSTRMLMAVSEFFQAYWFLMLFSVIVLFVVISIWKKTPDGHYMFDNFMLRVPVFGQITRKIVLSKFARILSGLVGSGISIVESLRITAEAVGNEVYKQRILLLAEDVSGGIKIYESLDSDKLFPDMMVQMIQVGEETAKVEETVAKVADFYDEQVDNTVSMINKLLEPFIIITLAIIVGVIALGVMEPIMGIADSVGK